MFNKTFDFTDFVKQLISYIYLQNRVFRIGSDFAESFPDDFRYKKQNVIFLLIEAFLFPNFIYSNYPLMSTRNTCLCRVLNFFGLPIHCWVLLMLLLQSRCPTKNINAVTNSTLSYIFLHSCFTTPLPADAFLFTALYS